MGNLAHSVLLYLHFLLQGLERCKGVQEYGIEPGLQAQLHSWTALWYWSQDLKKMKWEHEKGNEKWKELFRERGLLLDAVGAWAQSTICCPGPSTKRCRPRCSTANLPRCQHQRWPKCDPTARDSSTQPYLGVQMKRFPFSILVLLTVIISLGFMQQ